MAGEWRGSARGARGFDPPPAASYLLNVVALVEVDLPDRDALRSELSGYLMELAEMEGVPLERRIDGSPAYRWFDRYWVDDDRIPFFIEVSGEIAGFCLVRVMDAGWSIAEFGIRREWRRKGMGRRSVEALASIARGAGARHLRADVQSWNEGAFCFWTACGFRPTREGDGVVSTRLVLEPVV